MSLLSCENHIYPRSGFDKVRGFEVEILDLGHFGIRKNKRKEKSLLCLVADIEECF